ncbi:hypothetical protein THRCLA_23025 [Thraustotheca clavata]|uniref:Uncharacterized protein n=1 Tax=Thraustotheca clavata TaxID=74557 RepID=A0A1V9YID3_9STRA|nr:hypothetical protein THRCLA_23025 [Thraustotheca clavata]
MSNDKKCGRSGEWCWQHKSHKPVEQEVTQTNIVEVESVEVFPMPPQVYIKADIDQNDEKYSQEKSIDEPKLYEDEHDGNIYADFEVKTTDAGHHDIVELNSGRFLSTADEILAKCHFVGNDIDYKHTIDVISQEPLSDGYSFLYQINVYESKDKDEPYYMENFYFKSSEDRDASIKRQVIILSMLWKPKTMMKRLFKLCTVISRSWFENSQNLWSLAGFLFRKPHSNIDLMRRTYVSILNKVLENEDWFDDMAAIKQFDKWNDSKYHPKINEQLLKSAAEKSKKSKNTSQIESELSESDINCNRKLLALIANANELNVDELDAAINANDYEFIHEWREAYVKPCNRPITNNYKFTDQLQTAKLLALIIDNYYIVMMDGQYYRRPNFGKPESNQQPDAEQTNPMISMIFHINDNQIVAAKLMHSYMPLFRKYEQLTVSFKSLKDNSDIHEFNSCVPFNANFVES